MTDYSTTTTDELDDAHIGSAQWAETSREKAKQFNANIETSFMDLGKLLYQLQTARVNGDVQAPLVIHSWNYDSFQDYIECELNMHYKRAQRLARIWRVLEVEWANMDKDLKVRMVKLGSTKLRELIQVATYTTAEEWVEKAESHTLQGLLRLVTEAKKEKERKDVEQLSAESEARENAERPDGEGTIAFGPHEDATEKPIPKRFHLFPQQAQVVTDALNLVKQVTGSEKEGRNLEMICMDYMANNDQMGDTTEQRARYIRKLEKALNLRIIAVDPESEAVVYGEKILDYLNHNVDLVAE